MKKILFLLISIPLIFSSCEKEDDSPDSNSNSGNNSIITGTTGYVIDEYYDKLYKTTNSGSSWSEVTDFNDDLSGNLSPTGISFIN